jgi:hypothetical protein
MVDLGLGLPSLTARPKCRSQLGKNLAYRRASPRVLASSLNDLTLGAGGSRIEFVALIEAKPVIFGTTEAMRKRFLAGRCDPGAPRH